LGTNFVLTSSTTARSPTIALHPCARCDFRWTGRATFPTPHRDRDRGIHRNRGDHRNVETAKRSKHGISRPQKGLGHRSPREITAALHEGSQLAFEEFRALNRVGSDVRILGEKDPLVSPYVRDPHVVGCVLSEVVIMDPYRQPGVSQCPGDLVG
jgi:hypothetical protein